MPVNYVRSRLVMFGLVGAIFLLVNTVNAIRKGGDFDDYVQAAGRLLEGADPYAGSNVTVGFVGPPAQALPFVPFVPLAAADPRAARLAWYGLNLVLLWYALSTWTRLLTGQRILPAVLSRDGRSRDALLALLGIAFPLQTQFEHQNVNIVLLALGACAADGLRRNRHAAAGIALGAAAALKVYPAVALVWLAARRSWRTLGIALVAAAVLTATPLVVRGPQRFVDDVQTFRSLAAAGWPARPANQSVVAMWARYLAGDRVDEHTIVTPRATAIMAPAVVVVGLLVAVVLVPVARRRPAADPAAELAAVNAAGVLISPIAWEHYFVAWFPVLLTLRVHAGRDGSRAARWAFWIGTLCMTALSRATLGPAGGQLVRTLSLTTIGGLVALGTLAVVQARDAPPASAPAAAAGERADVAPGATRPAVGGSPSGEHGA